MFSFHIVCNAVILVPITRLQDTITLKTTTRKKPEIITMKPPESTTTKPDDLTMIANLDIKGNIIFLGHDFDVRTK